MYSYKSLHLCPIFYKNSTAASADPTLSSLENYKLRVIIDEREGSCTATAAQGSGLPNLYFKGEKTLGRSRHSYY